MVDLPFVIGAERSRLHGALFVGDVSLIVLLLSFGMVRHNENPLALPERAVLVIGPFVLSWLVVSYVLGAYTGDARRSTVDATENAAGTWLVAALVGAGLRSTSYLPGNAPLSFVAVVVATGAVALSAWRGGVTAIVGPAER
jgi:hypothetical protein